MATGRWWLGTRHRGRRGALAGAAAAGLALAGAGAAWVSGQRAAKGPEPSAQSVPTPATCRLLVDAALRRLGAGSGPALDARGLPTGGSRVWLEASDASRPASEGEGRAATLEAAFDAAAKDLAGKLRPPLRWLSVHVTSDDGAAPSARRHWTRPLGGCFWAANSSAPSAASAAPTVDGGQVHVTYRGHRLYGPTPAEAESALALAGDYLLRMLRPDGSFLYSYRADTGRTADDYNLLRHAGTALALLQLHEHHPRPELLAGAERALDYLRARILPCPTPDPDDACLSEGDEVKLGGDALALVALTEHARLTGDRTELPLLQALARRIVALQSPNGAFTGHKQRRSTGAFVDFSSSYYPGESLLALLRLHALDGDPRWLDAARRGATYLIDVRDKAVPDEKLEHDHWLLYALEELEKVEQDDDVEDHAERLVRAIAAAQNRGDRWALDLQGSWYAEPRTTPAATRSEGLLAAARLLARADRPAAAAKARATAERALRFELATQVREETALTLAEPQRALGGFRSAFDDGEIRIDFVQHNVAALLGYLARD